MSELAQIRDKMRSDEIAHRSMMRSVARQMGIRPPYPDSMRADWEALAADQWTRELRFWLRYEVLADRVRRESGKASP